MTTASNPAAHGHFQFWRKRPAPVSGSLNSRFLLWIDAVGGFLVSPADTIRIGQAVPGNDVELPLLADISRHHATIRRDAGGYVLEALREARVNDRALIGTTALGEGAVIELGKVRLRFSLPHPLSATARLDLVSRHQTKPSTTGVLLMAETCVLGPANRNHVVCRHWTDDVVLARQGHELVCRAPGRFEVSGAAHQTRALLGSSCRVAGDSFSFTLEPL